MDGLDRWGWDDAWAARFAAVAGDGNVPARVVIEHRELYVIRGPHGEGTAEVSGRFRHHAAGRGDYPAVGDWVAVRPPPADGPAVIDAVLPRTNRLSRTAPGDASEEQVLAANLDVLFLVASLNRDLNPRRLERLLTAAALPRCQSVLVLTKSDLCDDPAAVAADLAVSLGVPAHPVGALTGDGLDALAPYLAGDRTVALLGSSGVGKSTLLNRLLGEELLATGPIRADDDRGRHTTTHRELVRLPGGGLLLDSPGIREFALWADGSDVDGAFADIAALAAGCAFGDCTHSHEPNCAVRRALDDGSLDAGRFESYQKLQREQAYQEARTDERAARDRKDQERRIHRIYKKIQARKPR